MFWWWRLASDSLNGHSSSACCQKEAGASPLADRISYCNCYLPPTTRRRRHRRRGTGPVIVTAGIQMLPLCVSLFFITRDVERCLNGCFARVVSGWQAKGRKTYERIKAQEAELNETKNSWQVGVSVWKAETTMFLVPVLPLVPSKKSNDFCHCKRIRYSVGGCVRLFCAPGPNCVSPFGSSMLPSPSQFCTLVRTTCCRRLTTRHRPRASLDSSGARRVNRSLQRR